VVRMPLPAPVAALPELRVDGSSEGLLGSKLWGYRWVGGRGRAICWILSGAKYCLLTALPATYPACTCTASPSLPLRLAVRALDATAAPLPNILPAVSPQFIVTTTRVKGSVKPAVPLTTDPGNLEVMWGRIAGHEATRRLGLGR